MSFKALKWVWTAKFSFMLYLYFEFKHTQESLITHLDIDTGKPIHCNFYILTWKSDLAVVKPFRSCGCVRLGLGLSWEMYGLPCWACTELLGEITAILLPSSALWFDRVGERNGFWTVWGTGFWTKSFPNLDNCWVTAKTPPSATVMITQIGSENKVIKLS